MNDFINRPQQRHTSAPPAAHTLPRFYAKPRPRQQQSRRLPQWLQLMIGIPLIMIGSLFIQTPIFGQLLIAAYGLAAIIWRIPSRTTFILALLCLITTAALLLLRGNVALAQTFATYTFLLLVAGVYTLGRELKREGGRIYSIKQYKQY